jgi:oligosaccharide repeat unit polymerase
MERVGERGSGNATRYVRGNIFRGSSGLSEAESSSERISSIRFSQFLREMVLIFATLVVFLIVLPIGLWVIPLLASLSGLLIVSSLCAMQRLVGLHFRRLTIPSFFYFLYFAVILIPGFVIFHNEITPSRWRFLFGVESVLITVPVGIWLASRVLSSSTREIKDYFHRRLAPELPGTPSVRLFLVFLVSAVTLVILNIWETRVIPLLYLFRNPGEALTVALLREDSFKFLNSHLVYVYYVLRGTVLPFLILVAFGRYLQQSSEVWRRLFWITLSLGVLYAAVTVEKSPVATIFGLLAVFYYQFKGGRMGKSAMALAAVLFLSFPLMVVLFAYHGAEGGTLSGAIYAIGNRLFYSPAQIVYAYFEVFPSVVPFQHGASIGKLASLLGWKTINIPNTVGLYMTSGQDLDTITANSCFLGNLNADFGLPGVVVGGVLAGFLMQSVNVYLCRKPKTVVNVAAYAICMWAFGLLVASALPTVLLSGGVTFCLALRWVFRARGPAPEGGISKDRSAIPEILPRPTYGALRG